MARHLIQLFITRNLPKFCVRLLVNRILNFSSCQRWAAVTQVRALEGCLQLCIKAFQKHAAFALGALDTLSY